MTTVNGEGRLICNVCNKTFNRRSSLIRHRQLKHSEALEVFKCPKCPKILSRRDLLLRHMRLHQGEGLKACQHCSRAVRADYLPKHKRACLKRAGKSQSDSLEKSGDAGPIHRSSNDHGFVGDLDWKDILTGSKDRIGTADASDSGEYATRRVKQPARFVSAMTSSTACVESSSQAPGLRGVITSDSRLPVDEPRQVCSKLIEAIVKDNEDSMLGALQSLEVAGFTHDEVNELCVAQTGLHVLMLAAWEGSEDCTFQLSNKNWDANIRGEHGWTPLHCACANGTSWSLDALLGNGADVEAELKAPVDGSPRRITPLWLAVEGGHYEIAKELLLYWKANVEGGPEPNGPSPLQCACRNNDPFMAELLIDYGAHVQGKPGCPSPMEEAIKHRSVALIELLGGDSEILLSGDIERVRVLDHAANSYLQEAQRYFPAAFTEGSPLRLLQSHEDR